MTPNVLIAALIVLCATGLAVLVALRGHGTAPAFIILIGFWFAIGAYSSKPIISFSLEITKQTASEAEKDTP